MQHFWGKKSLNGSLLLSGMEQIWVCGENTTTSSEWEMGIRLRTLPPPLSPSLSLSHTHTPYRWILRVIAFDHLRGFSIHAHTDNILLPGSPELNLASFKLKLMSLKAAVADLRSIERCRYFAYLLHNRFRYCCRWILKHEILKITAWIIHAHDILNYVIPVTIV